MTFLLGYGNGKYVINYKDFRMTWGLVAGLWPLFPPGGWAEWFKDSGENLCPSQFQRFILNFSSLSFRWFFSFGGENVFLYTLRFSEWGPANLTDRGQINRRKKHTSSWIFYVHRSSLKRSETQRSVCLFVCLFVVFLGLCLQHVEVPRLGVHSEL